MTEAKMPTTCNRVMALYRVSTKGQVDKNDIPMQKQSCREFAQRQGWCIVKEFQEKGISGYKVSAENRDAMIELKKAAERKEFDILLVFMFDRIGRMDDETPYVVKWFIDHGIRVWSVVEGEQRMDSHVDKLMNYIRFWQANGESEKTSTRVKTRLSQMVQEGMYTGGNVPYGYKLVKSGMKNKKGKELTYNLFHSLREKFHGDTLQVSEIEEEIITQADLEELRAFLLGDSDLESRQLSLWPLYSFDIIPIQLISSIYELFFHLSDEDDEKGTYYTPLHLVNLLMDEVYPWEGDYKEITFFDPSCGSGIFLVEAYRRIVCRWMYHNNSNSITCDQLELLLTKCIFGVDINEEAIRVASFSLSVCVAAATTRCSQQPAMPTAKPFFII